MPQFDVFRNPDAASRRVFPFVVSLQSDLVDVASDRVVAPLALRERVPGTGRLTPVVQLDGDDYVVFIRTLETLPARLLPRRVANLARHRDALLGAVDLLFYGV